MELTKAGYVSEKDIMTLTQEDIDTLSDCAVLKAAAMKIEQVIPPHVITDESWVAQATDSKILDLDYEDKTILAAVKSNFIYWLRTSKFIIQDKDISLFTRGRIILQGATEDILYGSDSTPDVSVRGNMFHWAEHGELSALFSPLVVTSLVPVLKSEERLLKNGKESDRTTSSLIAFSKHILVKDVYAPKKKSQIVRL